MFMSKFMAAAVREAFAGMRKNDGGPFGAVIVKNGKIIARGHNVVIGTNDPTAHAEIVAIRKAAAKLKRFNISDCEIYSSCEPCPMCFGAIHWAKMNKLYYGATRRDAAAIGFDDKFIYDVIRGTARKKQVAVKNIFRKESLGPFREWAAKQDKTRY